MKARSCKNKGQRLQKWVCERIADIFCFKYDQQSDTCPIHSRESGLNGTDIVIRSEELLKKFPFSVECKNQEKVRLYEYIKQAQENKKKSTEWLIVHKKNRSDPIVIMDWVVFESLIRRINDKEIDN